MAPKKNKHKVVSKVSEETDNLQDSKVQPSNKNNSHAGSVSTKRQKTDEEIESYSTASIKEATNKERSRSKTVHRTERKEMDRSQSRSRSQCSEPDKSRKKSARHINDNEDKQSDLEDGELELNADTMQFEEEENQIEMQVRASQDFESDDYTDSEVEEDATSLSPSEDSQSEDSQSEREMRRDGSLAEDFDYESQNSGAK